MQDRDQKIISLTVLRDNIAITVSVQILKIKGQVVLPEIFADRHWNFTSKISKWMSSVPYLYPYFVSIVTKISTLFIFHVLYFVEKFQVRLINERKRIKASKFFLSLCDNISMNDWIQHLANKLVNLVKYFQINHYSSLLKHPLFKYLLCYLFDLLL